MSPERRRIAVDLRKSDAYEVGFLKKAMYGTRGGGNRKSVGGIDGIRSRPSAILKPKINSCESVFAGDDLTVSGSMPDLKRFAAGFRQRWTITEKGILGAAQRKKFDISVY